MDALPPYELDIAPDGERWRYRKRWTKGLRRFLPALWHATDEAGVKLLRQGAPAKPAPGASPGR